MVAALAGPEGRARSPGRRRGPEPPPGLYPIPERQPPAEPETQVQPIPQLRASAEHDTRAPHRPPPCRRRPSRGPADGHSPAGVATPPRPAGRCRGRRRCRHHCRRRHPAQPRRRPDQPGPSHGRHPAPCHHGGQGERRRSRHRPGNSPSGCVGKLDLQLDRASASRCFPATTSMSAGGSGRQHPAHPTWSAAARSSWTTRGSATVTMTSGVDPHAVPHDGDHARAASADGAFAGTVILIGRTL